MSQSDNDPALTQELLGITSQLFADDHLQHAIGVNALHNYFVSGRDEDAGLVLSALRDTHPERAAAAITTLLDTTDLGKLTPSQIERIIDEGYLSLDKIDVSSTEYTEATFSLMTIATYVQDELAARESAIEKSPLELLDTALIAASRATPRRDKVKQAKEESEIESKWLILDTPVVDTTEQAYINLYHDRLVISLLNHTDLDGQLALLDSRSPKSDEGAIAIAHAHDAIVLSAATTSTDPSQALTLLDRGARRPDAQTYFDDLHDTILIRALLSILTEEQFLALLAREPKTSTGKQKIKKIIDQRNTPEQTTEE